jgi:membrane protease YdiL (CAAX protease family)
VYPAPRPSRLWLWAGLALFPLSILLAPALYRLLLDLGWVDPSDVKGGDPFGKVLRRCLLLPIAVLVLGWLRPWRDVGLVGMGLRGPAARPRAGLLAFAVTLACLLTLLAAHVGLGWLRVEVNEPASRVLYRLGKTLVSGLVIACIEEWIFRAWLPLRLARRLSVAAAGLVAALLYAGLHAFRATHLKDAVEPSVAGAWSALGTWTGTLFDPAAFGPSFLGLLLFGLLLAAVYRRSRTLWASIGIHAASIWVLFAYGGFTEREATPSWAGTKVLYDGPLGWALLLVALWLVRRAPVRSPAVVRSGSSTP